MRPSAMPASLAICLVEVASKPLSANRLSAVSRICSRRAAASRCRAVGGGSVGALLPRISRLPSPSTCWVVECILIECSLSIRCGRALVNRLGPTLVWLDRELLRTPLWRSSPEYSIAPAQLDPPELDPPAKTGSFVRVSRLQTFVCGTRARTAYRRNHAGAQG